MSTQTMSTKSDALRNFPFLCCSISAVLMIISIFAPLLVVEEHGQDEWKFTYDAQQFWDSGKEYILVFILLSTILSLSLVSINVLEPLTKYVKYNYMIISVKVLFDVIALVGISSVLNDLANGFHLFVYSYDNSKIYVGIGFYLLTFSLILTTLGMILERRRESGNK